MVNNNAAADKGSKEATFTALTAEFKLDDKVKVLLMASPMENLEDFRYFWTEEKEIDTFVAQDDTLTGQKLKLQVSRMRRAWTATRQNGLRKENRNTVSSVAELDDLLEEGTLRDVKVQHWKRYKVRHPAEVTPSDQLLSRCYREMEKRLLTVYDIWKVKSLLHQVMTTKKRKQVGTHLFTFEDDVEVASESHDWERYLAKLYTYLLALSLAGSNKVQGAPQEEVFGTDATKFVDVPWDVLQSYYFRASRAAMLVPEATRLAWLMERDIAERAAWVSQFREGCAPLGQVVLTIMEKRGAHWDPPIHNTSRPDPAPQPQQFSPGHDSRKRGRGQQKGNGKESLHTEQFSPSSSISQFSSSSPRKMTPGTVAPALRDGKALCPDFNKGTCKQWSSCEKGEHKCAKVSASGRPCGMSNHGAHTCRKS